MRSPKELHRIAMKRRKLADGGPVLPGADDFVKGFKGVKEYAYGGRVLDERPGDDQGPEDSDLQDRQIERQDETADQNDHNMPMMRNAGQMLSNAVEDAEEIQHDPNDHGSQEGRREADEELLRHRRDRLRSRMK